MAGYAFSRQSLISDIMSEAKSIGLAPGAAEAFASRTADYVENWLGQRSAVTSADIDRVVATKLSEYNSDLAYFYQNNGKII